MAFRNKPFIFYTNIIAQKVIMFCRNDLKFSIPVSSFIIYFFRRQRSVQYNLRFVEYTLSLTDKNAGSGLFHFLRNHFSSTMTDPFIASASFSKLLYRLFDTVSKLRLLSSVNTTKQLSFSALGILPFNSSLYLYMVSSHFHVPSFIS